jgi:hypothetical protein
MLGGVPRLFPESALSEKEKASLASSATRIVFRVRDGEASGTVRPRQVQPAEGGREQERERGRESE